MLLMQAQENRVDLDEEQLLFLTASTHQTMFMANLSSAAPVYDEAGISYDADTLFEVQNHDNYLDDMNESLEEHEMENKEIRELRTELVMPVMGKESQSSATTAIRLVI
nr:hypothetical protein [Tanacetum cinerariifolium]